MNNIEYMSHTLNLILNLTFELIYSSFSVLIAQSSLTKVVELINMIRAKSTWNALDLDGVCLFEMI